VITRAEAQSGELIEALSLRGAIPMVMPLVEFAAMEDYEALDGALTEVENYDWLLFTSVNAVHAVSKRQQTFGMRRSGGEKFPNVAAVGPATQRAAEEAGFRVCYVAKNHLGVALAEELGERLAGARVLLPRSDRANPDLPAALRRLGANVTEVIAYRTVCPAGINREELKQLATEKADAILFFSPTAVRNFAELLGGEGKKSPATRATLAAVGPVTLAALRDSGLSDTTNRPVIVAADTTAVAVVDALEVHFAGPCQRSPAGAKSA
jgi:uroporphyrinogen III methyltransferase/synthase